MYECSSQQRGIKIDKRKKKCLYNNNKCDVHSITRFHPLMKNGEQGSHNIFPRKISRRFRPTEGRIISNTVRGIYWKQFPSGLCTEN